MTQSDQAPSKWGKAEGEAVLEAVLTSDQLGYS